MVLPREHLNMCIECESMLTRKFGRNTLYKKCNVKLALVKNIPKLATCLLIYILKSQTNASIVHTPANK